MTITSSNTVNGIFIDGRFTAPAGTESITVTEASTGQQVATVAAACPADVDAAVTAARRSFDQSDWPTRTPRQRAAAMRSLADELRSRASDTAQRVSTQNGMPIAISSATEAVVPAVLLEYYADLAIGQAQEEQRAGLAGGISTVRREPVGSWPPSCRGTSRRR